MTALTVDFLNNDRLYVSPCPSESSSDSEGTVLHEIVWKCKKRYLTQESAVMEIEKHFRQKVDVNARCHSGDTALHLAAMHNLPKICTKLLEKADVNAEDDTGRTPLHKAIETESHEAFTV